MLTLAETIGISWYYKTGQQMMFRQVFRHVLLLSFDGYVSISTIV